MQLQVPVNRELRRKFLVLLWLGPIAWLEDVLRSHPCPSEWRRCRFAGGDSLFELPSPVLRIQSGGDW